MRQKISCVGRGAVPLLYGGAGAARVKGAQSAERGVSHGIFGFLRRRVTGVAGDRGGQNDSWHVHVRPGYDADGSEEGGMDPPVWTVGGGGEGFLQDSHGGDCPASFPR